MEEGGGEEEGGEEEGGRGGEVERIDKYILCTM